MPLLVDSKPMGAVPKSVVEFIKRFPGFQESSAALCGQAVREVGPEGLLYVGQRELAGTSPADDFIKIIGSDDATTCHIVILRHTASNAVCISHLDGLGMAAAVRKMIDIVVELSASKPFGRLELHIAGGFKDDKKTSDELFVKTLGAFNSVSEDIHLITACSTDMNNVTKDKLHWPVIYGLAVNVKTGEIFRASFTDRGPAQAVRSARHFTGGDDVINIYDYKTGQLTIGPFNYDTMDEIEILCRLPDQFIREHLSTSPDQEPPHFEKNVRAALNQIKDFPDPQNTVFKDKKPWCYKKESNGNWKYI